MLEFLKLVIEVAGKAISGFDRRRDNRRMSEIGSELFLFYIQVNEAMMTGYEIIRSLEVYVERMSGHLAGNNDPYALSGGDWIRYKAQVQRMNLARIGETMIRWGAQLQIIDGEAFARIRPLLEGKHNALDILLSILRRDAIPLSITWDQILALAGPEGDPHGHRGERDATRRQIESFSKVMNTGIPLDASWDREIYDQIKLYLEVRNPQAQLDEIRHNLENIHAAIEHNFTLKDILLRVGDQRFSLRYGGEYFR